MDTLNSESSSPLQLRQTASFRWLVLLLFLFIAPAAANAQADVAEMSMNAHAKRHGGGWECDWGYRHLDQSCVAVQVHRRLIWTLSGTDGSAAGVTGKSTMPARWCCIMTITHQWNSW